MIAQTDVETMSSDPDLATLDLILRTFRVFDGFNGPEHEELWWRTDGEYAPVTLFANCNDLFIWGSIDCERIMQENIARLEQAISDADKCGEGCKEYGHLLWCARERKCVPQEPYFKYFPEAMHHLFRDVAHEESEC